jgi:hypothetical protein
MAKEDVELDFPRLVGKEYDLSDGTSITIVWHPSEIIPTGGSLHTERGNIGLPVFLKIVVDPIFWTKKDPFLR